MKVISGIYSNTIEWLITNKIEINNNKMEV